MSAMAQGLFCTLLIGTILNTVGAQFHIGVLTREIVNIAGKGYSIGSLAQVMAGPAMAVGIGAALKAPIMVLLTLAPVGFATNALGGAEALSPCMLSQSSHQKRARQSAKKPE